MNQVARVESEPGTEAFPHNIEAEQQLLGAILTNNEVYDRVASIIDAQHFYEPVHARIWEIASARIAKLRDPRDQGNRAERAVNEVQEPQGRMR